MRVTPFLIIRNSKSMRFDLLILALGELVPPCTARVIMIGSFDVLAGVVASAQPPETSTANRNLQTSRPDFLSPVAMNQTH